MKSALVVLVCLRMGVDWLRSPLIWSQVGVGGGSSMDAAKLAAFMCGDTKQVGKYSRNFQPDESFLKSWFSNSVCRRLTRFTASTCALATGFLSCRWMKWDWSANGNAMISATLKKMCCNQWSLSFLGPNHCRYGKWGEHHESYDTSQRPSFWLSSRCEQLYISAWFQVTNISIITTGQSEKKGVVSSQVGKHFSI